MCHVPPGNPANAHEISVSPKAADRHLANHAGDALGACPEPVTCPCWTAEDLTAVLEVAAANPFFSVDWCELYHYPGDDGDADLEFRYDDGEGSTGWIEFETYFDFDSPQYNECEVYISPDELAEDLGLDLEEIELEDLSVEEAGLCTRMISQICLDLVP